MKKIPQLSTFEKALKRSKSQKATESEATENEAT
jgi:hypothetical protein